MKSLHLKIVCQAVKQNKEAEVEMLNEALVEGKLLKGDKMFARLCVITWPRSRDAGSKSELKVQRETITWCRTKCCVTFIVFAFIWIPIIIYCISYYIFTNNLSVSQPGNKLQKFKTNSNYQIYFYNLHL